MNKNIIESTRKILAYPDDVKTYLESNSESEVKVTNPNLKNLAVSEILIEGVSDLLYELLDNFYGHSLTIDKTAVLSRARMLISYKRTPLIELNFNNVTSESLTDVSLRAIGNLTVGESQNLQEWLFAIDRSMPSLDDTAINQSQELFSLDESLNLVNHLLSESSSIATIEINGTVHYSTRLNESSIFKRDSNTIKSYHPELPKSLSILVHSEVQKLIESDKIIIEKKLNGTSFTLRIKAGKSSSEFNILDTSTLDSVIIVASQSQARGLERVSTTLEELLLVTKS